jgi:hypothetical protein
MLRNIRIQWDGDRVLKRRPKKKSIESTNVGVDRVIDTLGWKLDTTIDSINKVGC